MSQPLRVLLLEDFPEDAALVARELRRNVPEVELHTVDDGPAFEAALAEFVPELILSDHRLGAFNGMDALAMTRERMPDTPFIFVTGSLDEETAVACIKAGAWDYVLKDRLVRLGPAVAAALELKAARAAVRRTEESLLHTQRMEALGRLAGGVAHDYNNLTTAMLGYCELVAEAIEDRNPCHADLDEIRQAAERAAGLSRQLLAFSRRQMIEFRTLQLNDVVSGTERMLARLIGADVELATRLAPDLPPVRSDSGQLEQVLVNLVVNARDALPAGGAIRIETARVILDDAYCAAHPDADPGPHIMLAVSDNGTGIDEATLPRVFEPFFTTKPRGEGTGLGLATVYGVVRQSGGHIAVESAPGKGSTFRVYLPEAEPADDASTGEAGAAAPRRTGTETILLAEDDPKLRRLVRRVLEGYGYQVIEAASGSEALDLMDRMHVPIDLLLSDVVMPSMSGPELAARIAQRRSPVRILFMSGYTDGEIERHGAVGTDFAFLQKPFAPIDLARKVRQVLDA